MSLSHDPAAATMWPGTRPTGPTKRKIGMYRFAILAVLFASTATPSPRSPAAASSTGSARASPTPGC